jgi:hypothetical protein
LHKAAGSKKNKSREIPVEGVIMGLDFFIKKEIPTGIGFSYYGFHAFRHRVARYCGFPDVYPDTNTDFYKNDRWKELEETHPIYPLLSHSDCDGEMGPDDCGKVGVHLEVLVREWKIELKETGDPELKYDMEMAEQLSKLMLKCYEDGNVLVFR